MTMRVPLLSAIRWGGREEKTLDAGQTVELAQFVDVALLAPQELTLSFYATAAAPVAGLSVEWTLQLGNGSFNTVETFQTVVQDVANQSPLVLRRPASTVQISAKIISAAAPTKSVKVVANVAPTAPTWLTDVTCDVPVKDGGA